MDLFHAEQPEEFVNLTVEERKRAIKIAVDEANGKVLVVAGTGALEP